MKPNILMLHRIKLNNAYAINELYYKRKMVVNLESVFKIIEEYFSNGCSFGNIEQCINSDKYFHLSFDDGFSEHLEVAAILKEKYNPPKDAISFSVNIGNSFYHQYTGMDIVYELIKLDKINLLLDILKLSKKSTISDIKRKLLELSPEKLFNISEQLNKELDELKNTFLSKKEIAELSTLFLINSHGISHRDLTKHSKQSKKEILQSKQILETITKQKIDTFCYPEGKNDDKIQKYVKSAGYKYGLSIRYEYNNNYCIGRKIF
jgi:peptidoglycan/xylan/chitin deacetylase (PgdA/CDA1 family)